MNNQERRIEILNYYKSHNTAETCKKFSVSRRTLCRYVHSYDGTAESLRDGRTLRANRSYSEEEADLIRSTLERCNNAERKRNIIAPAFSEIYCNGGKYEKRRSYSAIRRKAARLIGKPKRAGKRSEKKKTTTGKTDNQAEPGWIQISAFSYNDGFFQYTAVDKATGWSFRRIFPTQCEAT